MRKKIRVIFAAAVLTAPCALRADTYPMLEQLNRETQSLYRDVQSGLVRVQLPTPKWIRDEAAKDDPLRKWGNVIEPRNADGSALVLHAGADGNAPGANANIGGPLHLKAIAAGSFAPNNIGLLISDEGHVLVPLYVERETIGNDPVQCMVADEKTNLTLLKMDHVVGKPIRIGMGRPMDGSLVMMLNPNNGSGRVQLWTGGERDFGVVVSMDGSVAGFARYGQFLNTAAAKPVIDQLLAIGKVQRAVLGVRLTELRADHQLRRQYARLGERPALSIDEVTPASPAEKAGLKAGDLILEFQNRPVDDLTTWSAMLAGGGEGRLLILREGNPVPIKMDLRPAE